MNQPSNTATHIIIDKLQALSQGLLYPSETDQPLDVVYFPYPPANASVENLVVGWAGADPDTPVQREDVASFFGQVIGDDAALAGQQDQKHKAFHELQEFMQNCLQDVQVYRVGERKITTFVLGKTPRGDYAGLKTLQVET